MAICQDAPARADLDAAKAAIKALFVPQTKHGRKQQDPAQSGTPTGRSDHDDAVRISGCPTEPEMIDLNGITADHGAPERCFQPVPGAAYTKQRCTAHSWAP